MLFLTLWMFPASPWQTFSSVTESNVRAFHLIFTTNTFISLSFVTSFFNPSCVSTDYSSLFWIYSLKKDASSISCMLHRKGFSSSPLPNMVFLHTKHIIQVLFVILLCCQNILVLLSDIAIKCLLGPADVSGFVSLLFNTCSSKCSACI